MVVEAIDGVMRRIRRLEALEYATNKSDGNILTNPGFEIWQRGTGPFIANGYTADRWYIDGTGATISVAPNVTVPDGSMLSARAVFTPGAATVARLYQPIENGDQYHGLTVGFTAKVYASVASNARLFIKDDAVYEYSSYHTGVAGWEDLYVARLLGAGIVSLSFGLELGPLACTVYIDNACAMVGSAALYTPRHPSDDWDRCLRYYETGHLCWRGYTPDNQGIYLPLTFVERKCEVPVITMSGGVYDIYGTVLTDTLVALDENTMCWQLATTGVGIGEVTDRHWIAEANCDPVLDMLYFSPGYPMTGSDELWKYDGTITSNIWTAPTDDGDSNITSLFWSQIDNAMYCGVWTPGVSSSIYKINDDDTVTFVTSWVWSGGDPTDINPPVDAAEFNGSIYLLCSGYEANATEIRRFDPVAGTCTQVYVMPTFEGTGGIAVDPVANQLVAYGGYTAYYSNDGSAWNLDEDIATLFDSFDGFSMITYNNKIYCGLQVNGPLHGPPVISVVRRDAAGSWAAEYTGPYDCDTDTNAIVAFTSMFDSSGAEQGLAGIFWAWFYAGGGIAIRDNAGAWALDWAGPTCNGFPSHYQMGVWCQSLAQFRGELYALFLDKRDWANTSLYKRATDGTWSLVQMFSDHAAIGTLPYTLCIATSHNTLKKCHEV